MTEKTLTTENIKPALDALRGELAPWPVVAKKQDRLNTAQLNAANSGITSSLVAQIIANTAAIRALESAITGTGLRALVVSSLPAIGTQGILYIVPVTTYDPDTDADVVNYSNEYIWIPVEGGTASEGHYEQVGQTGIVINNGQLTITVNGTSVGTFTANQSGDTTAAITVPTNADYVDRTTDQTIAGTKTFSSTIDGTAAKAIADEDGTSIKTGYVNVAGNQTVSGDKSFTGSNTFNNILPNATNTYSLGSSSYQWSSVYAQSYYYNGTEFSSKFVTTDTSQTINADKEFETGKFLRVGGYRFQITSGLEPGVTPSSNQWTGFQFTGANRTVISEIVQSYQTNGNTIFQINVVPNETNAVKKTIFDYVYNPSNNSNFIRTTVSDFMPTTSSVSNLGTSTNKWKTLNGVNPGALSLPSFSSSNPTMLVWSDLDITNWYLDGKGNAVSIALDGYVYVSVTCGTDGYVVITEGQYGYPNCYYMATGLSIAGTASALLPVRKGIGIYIYCKGTSIMHARFFPMQGNV